MISVSSSLNQAKLQELQSKYSPCAACQRGLNAKEQKLIGALGYLLLRVSNRLRLKEERPDFSEEIFELSQLPDVVIT